MQLMSASGALIYAGCWAATLSTALTNLLSVPRLIQALGIDRIYPGLIFFSKGYGKHGEPYRGYVLTFFISLLFLLIGEYEETIPILLLFRGSLPIFCFRCLADLNIIAPLISNFYLASYGTCYIYPWHRRRAHTR